MVDIDKLTLFELRIIFDKMKGVLYEHPEMTILETFIRQVKAKMEADPKYQKGKALYDAAMASDAGYDDGYCRAEDFYFAVTKDIIKDWNDKPTGDTHVVLHLCYKWNWWMNGENYRPHKDAAGMHRNFDDFVTPEMREHWDDHESYTDEIEPLRKQMLKVGMEELPALADIYNAHCAASRRERQRAIADM